MGDDDMDGYNPHKPRRGGGRQSRKSAVRAPRITYHKGVSWVTEMDKTVITRIDGKIYDFTDFVDIHPGGHDAIRSCNMRDSSITFFHTHGRDKNVNMLIKKYQVKDEGKIKRAEEDIPKVHNADKRLLEVNRKYDGKQFINVPFYFLRPTLFFLLGVYLVYSTPEMSFILPSMISGINGGEMVNISSRQSWWIGIALWSYAMFKTIDLGHQMSHQSIFKDPEMNRFANDYFLIVITGFSGRLAFCEHPEHHLSSNIIGMDPALMMPIEWREEAPLDSDPLKLKGTDVGRGFVIFLGSIFAFPYSTLLLNYQALFSKLRINVPALVAVWVIRTAILVYLVGPIPLILCHNLSMGLIGLEATTQHFDQPVMMPEEFYKAGMSFTELTLRSIQSWYEPGMVPPSGPWPVIAVDHVYHHFIPTLVDSRIPHPNLLTATKGLSPLFLRIGGSQADNIIYNMIPHKSNNDISNSSTTEIQCKKKPLLVTITLATNYSSRWYYFSN